MYQRQLCSLSLLERTINDGVRSSAAAQATAVMEGEGAEFICGESPSHKLAGPKYVVLAPDPCEDPDRIYVDVVVKKTHDSRQLSNEWYRLFTDLKNLGSWRKKSDCSLNLDDKLRQKSINTLTFTCREDPAPVDLPQWQESNNTFARRLTLRHLTLIFLRSKIIKSRNDVFTSLFEDPAELVNVGGARGIASRARFTRESLVQWFFSLDTYSKCLTFLQAVIRYLDAQATPVSLSLDDIYCDVFSQIMRPTIITRVKQITPEKSLSPTSDTKLLPVTHCINNFLKKTVEVTQLSQLYRSATGSSSSCNIPPAPESNIETIKRILRTDGASSDEEDGDDEHSVKAKATSYRGPFNKKKRKNNDIDSFSIFEGHKDGGVLSPFVVYVRREPIVTTAHNYLLFPVFASNKPEAEILFFVTLKASSTAALFLPGLFRNKNQYLCGDCKWMMNNSSGSNEPEVMWKYSLADYSPLTSCTEETSPRTKTSGVGTTTIRLKHLDVQPLCF